MTFKKVLHTYHCHRLIKSDNILHFLTKQCPFTQNFAKQTKKFYKTKSSQNYFLPLETPLPKSETQNLTKSQFFLGHPVGKGGKYKKKGKRVSHTLTQDDIEFLKKNTRYDEQEIKEWYR